MNTPNRHILIIEDDPAVANSLQEGLESNGYRVTWKNNGSEGIRCARDNTPHLMILDVKLPDLSGFDVCRQMRQLGLTQPILMLTVRNEEVDKILGLEMGADDYLTKPYSLRELLSRIRAMLRRAYGELAISDANMLYAGDLVIDRGRGQVWRGKQMIYLTPVEFRILVFLAQHPGQALSRTQILDAVWGYEATSDTDNTINAHIRRLREKVEADPSHPVIIQTVMGIGYRMAGG
ncbi:MAG: response regulator transcription factor [Anaerolineae bacterium]